MATKQEIIDRLSQCGGLSYQDWVRLLDSIYFDGDIGDVYEPITSNVLPENENSYTVFSIITEGTYTQTNGSPIVVPQGHIAIISNSGSTWVVDRSVRITIPPSNDLGTSEDVSINQNISTINIKGSSKPLKGLFISTVDANLSLGESYYNTNVKQVVTKVSDSKNLTYTPLLNTEYTLYDGRVFKWNGTDLADANKISKTLGQWLNNSVNQAISSFDFKSTPHKIKGAFLTTAEANLSLGESYFNLNTRQMVSMVTTNIDDRITYTPSVGTEFMIGNELYYFNGTDLILSLKQRTDRGFKTDFPNEGFAHKNTGVIMPVNTTSNTGFIPTFEGDKIVVNGANSDADAALIVFYDAKKEFISSVSGTGGNSVFWAKEITAPANAKYYIANTFNAIKPASFVNSDWWRLNYNQKIKEPVLSIVDKVSWTNGAFIRYDGVLSGNPTAKYSEKIKYLGGTIEVKGLSGTNSAVIVFYNNDTVVGYLNGYAYNDKTVYFWERHIPNNTTHFIVNATIGQSVVINVSKNTYSLFTVEKQSSNTLKDLFEKGRHQFGSSANYDVSNIPNQPAFVFRQSSGIYSQYDALMALYPDYITKVNMESDVIATKPSELTPYNFYMYRFRPTYAPIGINNEQSQNYNEIKVMIVTGTHDEPYAVETTYNLMKRICESWSTDVNFEDLRYNVTFYVVPCGNPWAFSQTGAGDGGVIRVNYNGVDLNRNMPTSDWALTPEGRTYSGATAGSEYETKTLVAQIDKIKPTVFIDFHNYGVDVLGNLFYIMSRSKAGLDVISEVISKNSRTLKKINTDYPQNTITILGWMQRNNITGTREVYASEKGAFSFTYECSPASVWKDGVNQGSVQRVGDAVLMRDNLLSFSYFILRVLYEISLRTGI